MTFTSLIPNISEWLGVIAVIWLVRQIARSKVRPVGFKYPAREGYVSLGLYGLTLILAFFFFAKVPQVPDAVGLLWQRVVMDAIALAFFILALLVRGQPLMSVGWGRPTMGLAVRMGITLVLLTIFLRGKAFTLINGVSAQEGSALFGCLGISLIEETIFRGYIQFRLSYWLGERWGWLAAAGLFVLWQIPRLIINPQGLALGLLIAVVQGLVLGWLVQTTRNVLAPVLYRAVSEWMGYLG